MELEGVVESNSSQSEDRHSARKSVLALLTAIAADDLKAKGKDPTLMQKVRCIGRITMVLKQKPKDRATQ